MKITAFKIKDAYSKFVTQDDSTSAKGSFSKRQPFF